METSYLTPKVSILIPTYNQSRFIVEAVESALNQDYENIEVIVSDDCSTDNTEQLLLPYKKNKRFTYYKQKKNIGRVNNYRFLLYQLAKGVYAVNIDGDDFYNDSQFISRGIKQLQMFDATYVYMEGMKAVDVNGNVLTEKRIHNQKKMLHIDGVQYALNLYKKYKTFAHSSCIYKIDKARLLDFYSFDALNTDFHSLLKLIVSGNVILSPETSLSWRIHGENASHNLFYKKNSKELNALYDLKEFIAENNCQNIAEKWFVAMRNYIFEAQANHYLSQNNLRDALRILKKRRKFDMFALKFVLKIMFTTLHRLIFS